MRIINKITEAYREAVRNESLRHVPSPEDISLKSITYEYYRANGELLRSETVTDRELTKKEIWDTVQLCGADRVRYVCECGIIPTVLETCNE